MDPQPGVCRYRYGRDETAVDTLLRWDIAGDKPSAINIVFVKELDGIIEKVVIV